MLSKTLPLWVLCINVVFEESVQNKCMEIIFVIRFWNVWGIFSTLIQELIQTSSSKTSGIHMYYSADIRKAKKLLKHKQIFIEVHQEPLKNLFQHEMKRVLAFWTNFKIPFLCCLQKKSPQTIPCSQRVCSDKSFMRLSIILNWIVFFSPYNLPLLPILCLSHNFIF